MNADTLLKLNKAMKALVTAYPVPRTADVAFDFICVYLRLSADPKLFVT
jgi:hypothetical protein